MTGLFQMTADPVFIRFRPFTFYVYFHFTRDSRIDIGRAHTQRPGHIEQQYLAIRIFGRDITSLPICDSLDKLIYFFPQVAEFSYRRLLRERNRGPIPDGSHIFFQPVHLQLGFRFHRFSDNSKANGNTVFHYEVLRAVKVMNVNDRK